MNLPTRLTLSRILLVPLFLILLIRPDPLQRIAADALFGIAMLTDYLDGRLARARGEITALGQLLDPVADKLVLAAVLVELVGMGLLPAWIVVLILGREFYLNGLRMVAAAKGIVVAADRLGKWKTTLQSVAVAVLLFPGPAPLGMLGDLLMLAALVLTVWSAVVYTIRHASLFSGFSGKD